jgi:hypothetical protein
LKDIEKGDKPNPNKKIVFVPYDANYFRTGDKKKDCVIRAISIAAMLGYKTVTELFNKNFIFGVGYASNSGISLEEVDEFADKTGIIEMIWGDKYHSMALDLFDDSTKYDTL